MMALLAVGGALLWRRSDTEAPGLPSLAGTERPVFLFDGRALLDATAKARELLPDQPAGLDDWGRFLNAFATRFAGLEEALDKAEPGSGRVVLAENRSDPDSLILTAERHGGLLRIALDDPRQDIRSEMVDRYRLAAMRSELSTLRSIAEKAPALTWKQRPDGTVTWANSAYMELARSRSAGGGLFGWPPPALFKDIAGHAGPTGERGAPSGARRVALRDAEGEPERWFEMMCLPGEGEEMLCFATALDRLVRAETQLANFVQTLTKTFAHLTVGLAIFDRKRQLALFNPALTDLTTLPPEFLSGRPTLHAFLDALRDRQRIPEPKDYRSWRLHIAQVEAQAADGRFEETWNLATGQTYRVTGRPHPGGAVAYMFEDISSEVSMTRSYRSDIELGQNVLDNLEAAIAVFSQNGVLVMSNAAFVRLWDLDPSNSLSEIGIIEATRHLQAACHPDPLWGDLRGFILDGVERQAWSGNIRPLTGGTLTCEVKPIGSGATMVVFHKADRAAETPAAIRQSSSAGSP